MTDEQGQIVRLVLICAAWAAGRTLTIGLGSTDVVVPAVLAIGAYLLTDGLARPRSTGGGGAKYWRGRRIDDDERRGGRRH